MQAMRIETARLRLRPFAADDLPELARLLADPDFMAWSVAGPLGESQARRKLAAEIASFEVYGFSKLAVEARDAPGLIGYCGLGLQVIEGLALPELGYRLSPAQRGRGLATEAARAVVKDAFGRLGLPEIYAYAEPDNAPSRRVIAKLGMTYLRDVRLHARGWRLYRLGRAA